VAPSSSGPPPNVLLITIDTLRADRVGVFGGPAGITPAIDRLGSRGTKFLDATSHSSLTVPSHASILTGQWPTVHGIRDNAGFVLSSSMPTLATRLKARGFQTGAVVASVVLGSSTGLARGFDRYVERFDTRGSHTAFTHLERRGVEVARDAGAWIRDASSRTSPFFLWVHLYDPHAPYDAPPAFSARFPGAPYNADVAAADWALGDVLAALSPAVAERTVLVVTADHGESLDEHGEPEHGMFVYDSTLHVPLVIVAPGRPQGVSVPTQVRHVDLVPTILDLVGGSRTDELPGRSLASLLAGTAPSDVPASYAESWFGRLHFGWSDVRSIRTGDWKYVAAPRRELYDLVRDPRETTNLAAARPALADRLAAEIEKLAPARETLEAPPIDSVTAERLRSLGYFGTGGARAISARSGADPKDEIGRYVEFVRGFYRALAELEEGRASAAARGFRALAREHPTSFEAHHHAGRALFAMGEYRAALDEYDLAVGLSPGYTAARFDASRAEAAMGRFEDARRRLSEALVADPASFYGQLVRGEVEKAAGNAAGAREAFERALELNPGMSLAHYQLGQLAEARSDPGEARRHYERAIESDQDFVDARRALARLGR
jgi:arylsulfatase A-like enzyme/thioredoxin-like negative regulator of GroEL